MLYLCNRNFQAIPLQHKFQKLKTSTLVEKFDVARSEDLQHVGQANEECEFIKVGKSKPAPPTLRPNGEKD